MRAPYLSGSTGREVAVSDGRSPSKEAAALVAETKSGGWSGAIYAVVGELSERLRLRLRQCSVSVRSVGSIFPTLAAAPRRSPSSIWCFPGLSQPWDLPTIPGESARGVRRLGARATVAALSRPASDNAVSADRNQASGSLVDRIRRRPRTMTGTMWGEAARERSFLKLVPLVPSNLQ